MTSVCHFAHIAKGQNDFFIKQICRLTKFCVPGKFLRKCVMFYFFISASLDTSKKWRRNSVSFNLCLATHYHDMGSLWSTKSVPFYLCLTTHQHHEGSLWSTNSCPLDVCLTTHRQHTDNLRSTYPVHSDLCLATRQHHNGDLGSTNSVLLLCVERSINTVKEV